MSNRFQPTTSDCKFGRDEFAWATKSLTASLWLAIATAALPAIAAPQVAALTPQSDAVGDSQVVTPAIENILRQSGVALQRGDVSTAILHLKNALQRAPKNARVRAQLGVLLLQQADLAGAERELRQARNDGAPDTSVLPSLFETLIAQNKLQDLLRQFPEPAQTDRSPVAADIFRARAIALQRLGRPAEANTAIEKSLAIRRNAAGILVHAELARLQGDRLLAQRLIDEILQSNPNDGSALILRIQILEQSGDNQQALTYADRLVRASPENMAARFVRVGVLLKLRQDDKAKADVDFVLAKAPNVILGLYYRAILRWRAKDAKGAWEIAQSLPPEIARSQPAIGLGIAQMALDSGNLEAAGSALSTVVTTFPRELEPRIRLAGLRLQQGNHRVALDVLTPVKDTSDPRIMALLGQTYAGLRQYDEAAQYFEKAVTNGLDNDAIKSRLALTEIQSGNLSEGIQELSELSGRNPSNSAVAGQLIATLVQAGRFDEALAAADRLARSLPKSPLAAFYRGQILSAKGDLDGAATSFATANQIEPSFIPATYQRALVLAARGDLDAANTDLDNVIARDPKNTAALIKKAEFAISSGQEDKAMPLLQRAAAAAPPNQPGALLVMANYHLGKRKFAEAEATVNSVLRNNPDNGEALVLLGQIQFGRGARDQALATYRRLASSQPQSAQAQILLANAMMSTGDRNGATRAYGRAAEINPVSISVRTAWVNHAVAIGQDTTAIDAARDYVARYPGANGDLLLANTLIKLKRVDEARAVLSKSIATNPDGRVVVLLSQVTQAGGDAKRAQTLLADWIRKYPDDVSVMLTYGQRLMQAGEMVGAKAQFEAVLRIRPYNAVALNNLAWLIQTTDPARALKTITLAAKVAPNSGEILDSMVWIKWQQNDRKDALPTLERARALSANNPGISYHWAVALEASGKRSEAKKAIDTLLASGVPFDGIEDARKLAAQWR